MTMKAKDEFFTTRSFIEKLTDARTLVNRKRFFKDEPMLDEVCAQDFFVIQGMMDDLLACGMIKDWIIGGPSALFNYTIIAVPEVYLDIFLDTDTKTKMAQIYEWIQKCSGVSACDGGIQIGGLLIRIYVTENANDIEQQAMMNPVHGQHGLKFFPVEYIVCGLLKNMEHTSRAILSLVKHETICDQEKLLRLLEMFQLAKEWDCIP